MENSTIDLAVEYGMDVSRTLIPNTVIFSVVLFIGVICNLFVLIVYSSMMRKDQMESRYFIPILSLYDLLVCLVSGTYFILDTQLWIAFESDVLCKIILFFVGHTMMTSDSFLLAIAVQRYVKICRPLGKQMTLFWRRLTVFLVIFLNFLYSIPTAVVSGVKDLELVYKGVNISGPSCFTGSQRYPLFQLVYYSILIFIVIFNIVITAGLYTPIACVIYKKFHKKGRKRNENEVDSNSKETEFTNEGHVSDEGGKIHNKISRGTIKKSTKRRITPEANFNLMFFTIITVYVLSYVPTCVMLVVVSLDDMFWINLPINEFGVYNWLIRSYAFNHAINPFIYAYFDIGFRHSAVSIFKGKKTFYLK
ncbi:hypothetical protein FSP39_024258 [Pinctada imbricata]|uniref:G-protein coupled receptors family 1 profile domain-containing protein n=1 Tax=Pinctada imbricata TaxID=66713 RepID=A0AA88Y8A6_PINIB|nr:hypothetical protein FSP39_024258 [Pinctada imbricata]